MTGYNILKWDSDFFGFPVARITEKNINKQQLKSIIDELKQNHVSLAYWSVNTKDVLSDESAKSLNGFFTGEKVIYVKKLDSFKKSSLSLNKELIKYSEKKPDKDLLDLIVEGGIFSRFYVDHKIGKKQYEELHKLWMTNSVKNNTIFVKKDDDKIIAFVSLNEKNNRGNIDFIVVNKNYRGKGLAAMLMKNAHIWFASNGYQTVQADTQIENTNACKMYEKLGYIKETTEKIYHFWL